MENRRIGNHTVCRFLQRHSAADSANEHKNSRMYLPLVDPFQFARARERALMPQKKKRGKKKIKNEICRYHLARGHRRDYYRRGIAKYRVHLWITPIQYDIFQQAFRRNSIEPSLGDLLTSVQRNFAKRRKIIEKKRGISKSRYLIFV